MREVREFMRKLVDPRTRHATAFYAATAVTAYDLLTRGFHPLNTALMALLAGVGTLGGFAALQRAIGGASTGEDPPGNG
jgi:4-hydroxybenzoate polyprenyltransferase